MSYSTEVLADSPALYLRLGETSGTTAVDGSTNGRDGTFQNAPTLGATGLLTNDTDKACEFDGVDQYVSVPGWAGLGGTGGKTLEVWFKTSNSGALISWGDDSGNERYELALRPAGDELQMRFLSGGFAGYQAAFGTFDDNVTHHVIVTWPDSGQIQDVVFYIDGAKQGSNASNGSLSINLTNSDPVKIGDGFASNFNGPFDGVLDEVSIYESEFTIGAINRHYLAGKDQITPFLSAMLATDPLIYYRLGETSFGAGLVEDDSGYGLDGDHYTPGNCSSVTGAVVGDTDTATDFSSPSGVEMDSSVPGWDSIADASLQALVKIDSTSVTNRVIGAISPEHSGTSPALILWIDDFGRPRASVNRGVSSGDDIVVETNLVGTGWHHLAVTYTDTAELKLYLDGSEIGSVPGVGSGGNPPLMTGWPDGGEGPSQDTVFVGHLEGVGRQWYIDGEVDEWAMHASALTPAQIASIATATGITFSTPYAPTLAITWDIGETFAPVPIAIEWNIGTTYSADAIAFSWQIDSTYTPAPIAFSWDIAQSFSANTVAIKWSIPQATHFNGSAAAWGATVTIGAEDVSARLRGTTRIRAEEMTSTLCTIEFVPSDGPITLSDWENKPVAVDFDGYESGALTYSVRRFTGQSLRAEYDAERGRMTVEASTDIQGRFEAMSRTTIDATIQDADYSIHVFDENSDGWQYAQDRISTRASEFHVDHEGLLRVEGMQAKVSPDITFTDATRFGGTLDIVRASKSDLVNKIRVSMDFRFTRLRQREVGVNLKYASGVCAYIINPFNALQRSQVAQAASSQGWNLIGEINYDPMPGSGVFVCANPPGPAFPIARVAADQSALCLGASWKSAKRFAQTVTETTFTDVTATDSIEAVGELGYEEEYGVESEFDSSSWESEPFTDKRSGSVVLPSLDDVVDEDQITEQARADYEAAQVCAIAKAKAEIQRRHRGNRVTFEPKYRPDIDLGMTLRADAGKAQATGKAHSYEEVFDFDRRRPSITVTLAVSRHGGSGLAVDDPIAAQAEPDAPAEDVPVKQISLGYHIGGDVNSPAQQDDWVGFITNRQVPPNPTKLYDEKLLVEYPEIEPAARDESTVSTNATINVAIDEDELAMSR